MHDPPGHDPRLDGRRSADPDPSVYTFASTWSTGLAVRGDLPYVRDAAKDRIDQFINAWLSVNPKK